MKLEQQINRIFTAATNAAADVAIARAQQGKPHDDSEALRFLRIKVSAIEQAIVILAGKIDEINNPAGAEDPGSPIGL